MIRRKERQSGEKLTVRTILEPTLFLAPFLIGLILFTVYPFINVIIISFKQNYKILTGAFSGFGLDNYQAVISDPYFLSGLKNTFLYMLFVVPIATALSLLIATMLNGNVKCKALFQTCYSAHGHLHHGGGSGLEVAVQL